MTQTAKLGFELKGQFKIGCQWRAICVKVWIKQDCMISGFELKGHFNIGHQWWRVVSGTIVRIIREVLISKGQIIWDILYYSFQLSAKEVTGKGKSHSATDTKRIWQNSIKTWGTLTSWLVLGVHVLFPSTIFHEW